jgi:glycosyltransferase involved in cell wall biosynthesis
MAELANDPARRARMAEDAKQFAQEWTTEACARRLADVYRGMTASAPRPN